MGYWSLNCLERLRHIHDSFRAVSDVFQMLGNDVQNLEKSIFETSAQELSRTSYENRGEISVF